MTVHLRRVRWGDALAHCYIWLCLAIFVMPFAAVLQYSFADYGESAGVDNYSRVVGSFGSYIATSVIVTVLTLMIDGVLVLPVAYGVVRYPIIGRRLIFSGISLPLYVPAVVTGLSLVLMYSFVYHLTTSMWGLVFAMAVGTFPLMLTPVVVAMRDLPIVFEEAAACLGASRWQTYRRVVFPLIGPGVGAGLLLSFVVVFNEYLVTLFVHPPGVTTAPLQIFNLVRTAGILPTTAALAVTLQMVSLGAVLLFLKVFGARYLRGTYLF